MGGTLSVGSTVSGSLSPTIDSLDGE